VAGDSTSPLLRRPLSAQTIYIYIYFFYIHFFRVCVCVCVCVREREREREREIVQFVIVLSVQSSLARQNSTVSNAQLCLTLHNAITSKRNAKCTNY